MHIMICHGVSEHRPKLALFHTFQIVLPYFLNGKTMYYSWSAYFIFPLPHTWPSWFNLVKSTIKFLTFSWLYLFSRDLFEWTL